MSVRLSPRVSAAETEYGTVLLDQRSGDYFQLNPTGTLVVRTLLDGGVQADAVEAITREFDVDSSMADADVTALVAELRQRGLILL